MPRTSSRAMDRTYPVQVGVGAIAVPLIGLGHVIVDDNVDALNVDATPHQVCGHEDALLALLEGLVYLQPVIGRLFIQCTDRRGTSATA